ncbi:MAG: manganese efflux pump MntP family protein [Lachnospiraceae bacterium]|jgi:putative Mn2+ efflux pump MntP
MNYGVAFFLNSILLGVGLAMDAFSVSLANGLYEPCMKKRKMCGIAGTFAFFQALMPMLGWICVRTILRYLTFLESLIPWIAFALLGYIGGKMLQEGIQYKDVCPCERPGMGLAALLVQGLATSIDALSVGFTITEYDFQAAFLEAMLIAVVTFVICIGGLMIGKKAGAKLAGKAGILGGTILILIGLEIFISSWV